MAGHDPCVRGVASAYMVQDGLKVMSPQPTDQLRQQPRQFFFLRLRNDGNRSHRGSSVRDGMVAILKAAVEKKFAISLGPVDWRIDDLSRIPAQFLNGGTNPVNRQSVPNRRRDNPAFANMLSACLEL